MNQQSLQFSYTTAQSNILIYTQKSEKKKSNSCRLASSPVVNLTLTLGYRIEVAKSGTKASQISSCLKTDAEHRSTVYSKTRKSVTYELISSLKLKILQTTKSHYMEHIRCFICERDARRNSTKCQEFTQFHSDSSRPHPNFLLGANKQYITTAAANDDHHPLNSHAVELTRGYETKF